MPDHAITVSDPVRAVQGDFDNGDALCDFGFMLQQQGQGEEFRGWLEPTKYESEHKSAASGKRAREQSS